MGISEISKLEGKLSHTSFDLKVLGTLIIKNYIIYIYNIIQIYINRVSITMQIFMSMDYLILMSVKYPHFRKKYKYG